MSATTQKPFGELPRATPAFSYAQAAKGRSPSGPPSVSTEKASKGDQDTSSIDASAIEQQASTHAVECSAPKRAASEGGQSHNSNAKAIGQMESPIQATSGHNTTSATATPATQVSEQSQVVVSTPSSPEFGVTSASTLLKDDDLFSNANASSDSTWEKLSQGSQNGSKTHEKTDNEKEPAANGSWDEETLGSSAAPALKEAPPPAVNFWQQRIEAKAAKQPSKPSHAQSSHQVMNGSNVNGATKPFDIGAESTKHESKKQIKRGYGPFEEKPATAGAKDSMRSGDGRTKSEVSEAGSQRAARTVHQDRSTAESMPPPPPPGDAQSWPTPDTAQDEEKKKAQERAERGEKEKSATARAHGKEKWMPVPYVPSVQFSTPIPTVRRGARAPRGGRDSGPRGGPSGVDKPRTEASESAISPQAVGSERARGGHITARNASSNTRPKRASSAGPPLNRDQRRGGDMADPEKRKDERVSTPQKDDQINAPVTEIRRASAATQDEFARSKRVTANLPEDMSHSSGTRTFSDLAARNAPNGTASDSHAHPRSAGHERKGEGGYKSYSHARDFHHPAPTRERGEGRPDRGRGGYRSRGAGNHAFTHSNHPNGHIVQQPYTAPAMPTKAYSNHERHASQLPNPNYHSPQTHGRSFRSGSGSYTTSHATTNARFPQGPPTNTNHQLPHLQTDIANSWGFQPGNEGIMSANPYNSYMEHVSIFGMVSMQMEYYFSVDNLCKDLYLRKHMDSQGFVFLSVLAKFNRIRQLTQDLELIRYVCLQSPQIEYRTGSDGFDRLRKREGWQQWTLAMEERDPSVQNDGPSQIQQPYIQQQLFQDVPYGLDDRQLTSPPSASTYNYQHPDTALPNTSTSPSRMAINGDMNSSVTSPTTFPVTSPGIAPNLRTLNNAEGMLPDACRPSENTFTDEQVDLLMIVVRKPLNHPTHMSPPFHSASSRTFSNGSIDGRTINDELARFTKGEKFVGVNGDVSSDVYVLFVFLFKLFWPKTHKQRSAETRKVQRPRSPFPGASPSKRSNHIVSPPVFWVKDKDTPIDSLPEDLTHEPYNIFRRNALLQRERTPGGNCHYDMDILYQFWSHFLIRNFNSRMYQEFRQTAFEDAEKHGSNVGLKNLVQYYNESILSQKVVSDPVATDFLDLVKSERTKQERPAFDKLRAAWRNGAFNMKNRKKLDSMIDASLKAELER
ncbi:MAG: hypothetical protein Q9188_006236 [Gyalolechia gomerana]